jgi:hypothetical protein
MIETMKNIKKHNFDKLHKKLIEMSCVELCMEKSEVFRI